MLTKGGFRSVMNIGSFRKLSEKLYQAFCTSSLTGSLWSKHVKDRKDPKSQDNDVPEQGSKVEAECDLGILSEYLDVLF